MPLLMIDLDNTLVDRDAAFRAAATTFLAEHGLPEGDLNWLMAVDASGCTPRREVARTLSERYGGIDAQEFLDRGAADRIILSDPVREALVEARADGWSCVIVTNGRTVQQETKIRNVGLDRLVHGWVISEAAGHWKPEPEIFHAAAAVAGAALDGSWMIGDSAPRTSGARWASERGACGSRPAGRGRNRTTGPPSPRRTPRPPSAA